MASRALAAGAVEEFVHSHTRTVIITCPVFMDAAPASLRRVVEQASFQEALPGNLGVYCF